MMRLSQRATFGCAVLCAFALVVAACGDDVDDRAATPGTEDRQTSTTLVPLTTVDVPTTVSTPPPTTTTTSVPSTTTTLPPTTTTTLPPTATTTLPPFVGGTDPVSGERVGGIGLLTDARMAGHGNFDRFVLEFADEGRPEFLISYTSPPFINIPGNMVGVVGNAFLAVNLPGATTVDWDASTDGLVVTYDGSDELRAGTTNITEAVFVTDFESDMEWLIGLAEKAPFTVMALDDPYRIVVDVGHGSLSADDVATQAVTGNTDIRRWAWLTDARLAGHDEFDRFVLEFSADHVGDVGYLGVPAYSVHYVAAPFVSCDPQDEVPVVGNLFVFVDVRASVVDWSYDPPLELYDGPTRHTSDTSNVREAVLANDCLGLQWVLGLDHGAPFTVSVQNDPPRLVVDVAH